MKQVIRLLIVTTLMVGGLAAYAQTAYIPNAINYQGTLTDNNGHALDDGSYSIIFRIYSAVTAGSCIWSREYPVYLNQGQFAVLLGPGGVPVSVPSSTTTNILQAFEDKDRFMELAVSRTPSESIANPEPILPRQRIVTAPYAIHAYSADRADKAAVLQLPESDSSPRITAGATAIAFDGAVSMFGPLERFETQATSSSWCTFNPSTDGMIRVTGSEWLRIGSSTYYPGSMEQNHPVRKNETVIMKATGAYGNYAIFVTFWQPIGSGSLIRTD